MTFKGSGHGKKLIYLLGEKSKIESYWSPCLWCCVVWIFGYGDVVFGF